MPDVTLPPLIPREVIFGNPERMSPVLSPDGSRLAYIAPDDGVLNVWVRTLGASDDRVVTRDRKRGIRTVAWAYDNRTLLYVQDVDGDENWHVWSVDLEGNAIRDLTPFLGSQANLLALEPARPLEALVTLNARDARFHDVYRLDLVTGALVLTEQNPGDVIGWVADADMNVRAVLAATPEGGFELRGRTSVGEQFRSLVVWPPEEEGQPYAFSKSGDELFISSTLGSNTSELRVLDLRSGSETVLARHELVDIGEVLLHPTERTVQAVGFVVHRMEWRAIDPAVEHDLALLAEAHPGEYHVQSRDLADRTWIVQYVRDDAPSAFYLYHRDTGRTEFLFTTRPALEHYALASMSPVEIPTRDGLTMHCYLTLPVGVGPTNLPLVLNVHGGPYARDVWGYDAEAQWLANRGYACLQVNYRGSSGFGKAFLHAADREWGAKMHDDLIDAVNWAIGRGYADRNRVAIYGASYGGYAALVGAAFTPDFFACAVDVVGPSSLRTLIASIPPYWEPMRRMLANRIGDPDVEPEFLDSRSPLYKAADIVCPLLIAQGANDPRVKQAESEQIVKELRERGKPVEYLLFEDEGHGFARPENRLRFYEAAERFLSQHLGGRTCA